jgi:hypothetical protein
MTPVDPIFVLLERVADVANELGIETAVIGAVAMAAHNYVRATADADLGTYVDPYRDLGRLRDTLAARGLHVDLRTPDDEDPLGGVLRVWEREDSEGDPIDYVDVVNFNNPHRPGRRTPGFDAIRHAIPVESRPSLRFVGLAHLIALKLYTGGLRDKADVVELLRHNSDADMQSILEVARSFGLDAELSPILDELARRR